jgi:hypothetical protein
MPKITHIKEINGEVWARLHMDFAVADGPLHIFTQKEVNEMKARERQDCWDEIKRATRTDEDY